jgi:hypothetical protein
MADYKKKQGTQIGAGVALGVGVGLAIGNALDNVGLGLAIGIAIGLGGGSYWNTIDQGRATNQTKKAVVVGAAFLLLIALIVSLTIFFVLRK